LDFAWAFWIIWLRWSSADSGSSVISTFSSGCFPFHSSTSFCMLPDVSLPVANLIGPRPSSAAA
jgi:hypothetical protein